MVKEVMFGVGEENPYGEFFVGKSYLNILTTEGVMVANVTFEPGCRNNWHIHHAEKGGGQILLATDGEGWYQEEGQDAIELKPGMVVEIKPNVKHWHGAQKDSWFSHISVEVPGEDTSNEWLEVVDDEHYNNL
jgi:quercetin dioxygenase-like cupin family protein